MPEGKEVLEEQVLADIKRGLSDDELMNKYGLSPSRLDLVFAQLMYKDLITKSELDARNPLAGNPERTRTGTPLQDSLPPSPGEPPSGAIAFSDIKLDELGPSDETLRDYERKAFWGIVASMLLGVVGAGLSQASDPAKAVGVLINLIGFGLYFWGFHYLVKRKGYHWAWTFLCVLSGIGVLIIVLMKDKYKLPRSRYMKAIIALIIIIPIVIALLGIILAISIPYYISHNRTACDNLARQELVRLQAAYDKYRNDPNNRTKETPGNLRLLLGPYYGWTGTDEKCQVRIKYDRSSHEARAVAIQGGHPQGASSRYVYRRNLASGSEQTSTIPAVDPSEFTTYPLLGAGRGASCFDDHGTLREECGGKRPTDEAVSLNNLAEKYRLQKKYAEAEPLYKRSLEIRENKLGPEHPDVAQSLHNLAEIHRLQGKYAEAEPLFKRSLAIREKALGPEHPDVAQSLNNLALVYGSQRKYAEAEPLHKRSLAIREKKQGPEHVSVVQSLNNLALLYSSQRKYSEAEPLYRRSLEIREKKLAPDHPDLATSLNNLAEIYRLQRKYAEAEPLYKRSLEIREKKLGPEHPDVAQSLNNLALIYKSQKKYSEAEPLFKRSLSIYEGKLGPNDPLLARVLNNLAETYRLQRNYPEAELMHKRSLEIREKKLGPEHPDVAQSLNNLALVYKSQMKYSEAESLLKRSLSICEAKLGPNDPLLAKVLNNLAEVYRKIGKEEEASKCEELAQKIRSQSGSR
jgi:tetratricopeptide (TPR) repeat protein